MAGAKLWHKGERSPAEVAAEAERNSGSDFEKSGGHTYPYGNGHNGEPQYEDGTAVCPPHTTERKLLAKIDWHVVPCLCILYLLAFLDRVNIANANVYGLSTDLKLKGTEYNTALVIFFVPYILFEVPSNLLLKRFKPHVWLSVCMFAFGLVTVLQGFVRSYSAILATRFFLGFFEAAMFPGCFYILGSWYRRHEAQRRFSFFFMSTTLAGAFGGLLAAAIGKMDGAGGYEGWRWIFLLEGAVTCVVAVAFFFLLPGFPEESKWLSEDEKQFVAARLRIDQGASAVDRKITAKDVGNCFKDVKVWLGGFMYLGLVVPAYGYAYFAPTLIGQFGYSRISTQLHSVAPWAAAFAFAMIIAILSDKTRHRAGFAIGSICVAIAGFGILLGQYGNTKLQYGALFMVAMGCYTAMPIIVCWFNMNLGGHHRRSVGSAWQVSFGNIGGIIAVYAFLKIDAPRYIKGYSVCLAFTVVSIVSCLAYYFACKVQNRNRERSPTNLSLTEYEKTELGDMNPDYRYLL